VGTIAAIAGTRPEKPNTKPNNQLDYKPNANPSHLAARLNHMRILVLLNLHIAPEVRNQVKLQPANPTSWTEFWIVLVCNRWLKIILPPSEDWLIMKVSEVLPEVLSTGYRGRRGRNTDNSS
jgi:hypothetical protein